MNSSTSRWPSVSFFSYPVMAVAVREQDLDRLAHQVVTAIAKQLFHLGIDRRDATLPVHHYQAVGCAFDHGPKLRLARAESLCGPLLLRDVSRDRRRPDGPPRVVSDRGDSNRGGKLLAALPDPEGLHRFQL